MRRGRLKLTLIDAILVIVLAAIATAVGVPVLEMASRQARRSTALENLHGLRMQIELYRAEHGGRTPAIQNGSLPQLCRPTNALGVVGDANPRFPLGPYLAGGMPVNPLSGRAFVTAIAEFPPKKTSGNGGWLYCPATGQITLDHEDYLHE